MLMTILFPLSSGEPFIVALLTPVFLPFVQASTKNAALIDPERGTLMRKTGLLAGSLASQSHISPF